MVTPKLFSLSQKESEKKEKSCPKRALSGDWMTGTLSTRWDNLVIFEKNSSASILFSVRVHAGCDWPNSNFWILVQRREPGATLTDSSFSGDCVHISLSAEDRWLLSHAPCVSTHANAPICTCTIWSGLKARRDNAWFSCASSLLILTPSMPSPSHCCLSSQT